MTRFTRATAAAGFVGLLLASGADSLYAQRARDLSPVTTAVNPAVLNNQPDLIEITGVSFRDTAHSDHFQIYPGHPQQIALTLRNKTTNQGFSDLVATVRKIAGAGAYEVSWTIGAVPPPGTNLVIPPGSSNWGVPLAKPMWNPEPGEHTFEITVDAANTLREAAAYVGNNRREVTVTPAIPPAAYTQQPVNPSAVGPAGLLFALNENDPSNLCEATFEYTTGSVKAKLRYLGAKPAPDGFIACEARVDFYRYARIANDWEIVSVYPSPPTGALPAGAWYVRPEGKSLHTQIVLRIPAEAVFYPNSSGLAEMSLVITLRGLSGTQPTFMAIPPGLRIR
jgi:hypothetical protein